MQARQDDRTYVEFLATRWKERILFLGLYVVVVAAYDVYRGYGLLAALFGSLGVNLVGYWLSTTIIYVARRWWQTE